MNELETCSSAGRNTVVRFGIVSIAACFIGILAVDPAGAGSTVSVGVPHNNTRSVAAQCPTGEFAIGVRYRGGSFLNAVQLRCGKISGSSVVFTQDTGWVGAHGGNETSFADCAAGKGVVGLSTKASMYVDSIANYQCSTVNTSTHAVAASTNSVGSAVGGDGGVRVDLRCPGNEVLYRIHLTFNWWVDTMVGGCRQP